MEIQMSRKQIKLLMDILMQVDGHIGESEISELKNMVNRMVDKFGYSDWIEAYHDMEVNSNE